jgi:hypothetical protein
MGVPRLNFLTDDPWNPKNGANFFWKALKEYDVVFTPRRANISDLRLQGCARVEYLPFAYNPEMHFPELPLLQEERESYACDLAILGGADSDRIPVALEAIRAGLTVRLYGGYWDKVKDLRPFWGGFVYDQAQRFAAGIPTAHVCMGRKANRDGHAMRSFELPAMGACLLVEDTAEHRDLFGHEGDAVLYYDSIDVLIDKALFLRTDLQYSKYLARKVRSIIISGKHTYADRMKTILDIARK